MMSSCWAHYLCYRDWGAPSSRGPLAVAEEVGPGFAGYRATGGEAGPGRWMGEAKDNGPEQDSALEQTGEESLGAGAGAGVDVGVAGGVVERGGCGAQRQA